MRDVSTRRIPSSQDDETEPSWARANWTEMAPRPPTHHTRSRPVGSPVSCRPHVLGPH
jgi:hypothetical protein